MSMARRNIVASLALIGFACWYAYLTIELPDRDIMPNTPGPAFFPTIIVSAILLLSLAMFIVGLRDSRKHQDITLTGFAGREGICAIGAFGVYLAVLPYSGFILASIPFFAVLMYLYGARQRMVVAVVSIAMPLVLYTVFRHGFQIVLPRGILAF